MAYSFLKLAVEILSKTKIPMTANEIWEYAKENKLDEKINSSGKTPWKTLGAQVYVDIKNNKDTRLIQVSKIPAKFGLVELEYDLKSIETEIEEKDKSQYKEIDLHPLLTKFVFSNQHFRCYTKTIDHKKSKKRTAGAQRWQHPDIIGVHFPYEEYSEETINLISSFNESAYKLYAFEMKKSLSFGNYKECYFQALSNTSWANEGYLVALNIDESEEFIDELRNLNNSYGVGVIKLNAKHIAESEILFPARYNKALNWDAINRLVEDNTDFKEFVKEICKTNKINEVSCEKYDKVLDDEDYQKYLEDKKIF